MVLVPLIYFLTNDLLFSTLLIVPTWLTYGLVRGLGVQPQVIDRPRQLVVQGIAHTCAICVACVAFSFSISLASNFAHQANDPTPSPLQEYSAPVSVVLAVAVLLALSGTVDSPWPRYAIACALLGSQKKLPWRLARFLDWAHEAGFLRMAGLAVQFRHQDFQAWLAKGNDTQGSGQ